MKKSTAPTVDFFASALGLTYLYTPYIPHPLQPLNLVEGNSWKCWVYFFGPPFGRSS